MWEGTQALGVAWVVCDVAETALDWFWKVWLHARPHISSLGFRGVSCVCHGDSLGNTGHPRLDRGCGAVSSRPHPWSPVQGQAAAV